MNLYLLEQNVNDNWDTYDSMIICAADPDEAVELSYRGFVRHYIDGHGDWIRYDCKDRIQVELIGAAVVNLEKGIVLSSFNAG